MQTITPEQIQTFRTYLVNEEKSQATLEKYVRDVVALMQWLKGRALEKAVVLEYKQHLIENYAPASANSMLSSINSFFVFMQWYDCKVKTLKLQRKIFANQEKELTKSEYKKLLSAAKKQPNERLYLLLQTICSTGIRVSELRYITTDAVRKGEAIIHCKGKMRVIILPKQLCKMLLSYCKKQKLVSGPVFITKTGQPMDRSNIWKLMKKLCDGAGVAKDKVFPHNFRHLFARTFYSVQRDIVRLADILGHSSVNTTRIYTMETGEVHRMQMQRLGLLLC